MEIVYKGRNSPFLVEIMDVEGALYPSAAMATITRCRMKVNGFYADSAAHAGAFDWATYAGTGELAVDLGLIDFAVGTDLNAELLIYDAVYTSGRVAAVLEVEITDAVESGITVAPVVNAGYGLISSEDITADGDYSGFTEHVYTDDLTVAFPDVLAKNLATDKWVQSNASALATMPGRRMALAAPESDGRVLVLIEGYARHDVWNWTVDNTKKELYCAASAGALTETPISTAGHYAQSPAEIHDANTIYFHGTPTMIEVV